jgi:RNA polymerase sigma factor (TIGR02999 family)
MDSVDSPRDLREVSCPLHKRDPSEESARAGLGIRINSSPVPPPGDLTVLLQAWSNGDSAALEQLAPLVHHELRAMARRLLAGEPQAHEWQPSDLLQESYVRLLDWRAVHWQSRAQFFATTARMMRRVLVDAARARHATKRAAGLGTVPLEGHDVAAPEPVVDFLALDDALASLAALDPRPCQVIELRFFGGFTVEETAEALGVSVRTVIYDWNTARAWLQHALGDSSAAGLT